MTYLARRVLDDCELALEFLEQSTTDAIWRVHWFAAVALVRTVGDVLHKVDGQDPALKPLVNAAFQRWKEDPCDNAIFWDFIKNQRDRLVHEYDSDAHPSEKISLLTEFALQSSEGSSAMTLGEVFELDENIYRPMLAGPWEGDDARDVLKEAIDWWKRELNAIDQAQNPSVRPIE